VTVVHVVVPAGIDDVRHPSGGNVYDRRLCEALVADGWRVLEHPVRGGWPRPDGRALAGLAAALKGIPAAEVVVLDGLVASSAPEALRAAAGRLRLVVLVHAPLGDGSAPADLRRAEAVALSAADAVLATSSWSRQWLLDHYGLAADRVHVAEPGVVPAPYAPGTRAGGELLCVAAVTPGKGPEVLLAALATLTDLPWRCRCVGALDLATDYVAALRRQVADTGLGERVCFTGPQTGADLERAYAAADVLVLASKAETYGLVVTEALAHGLPVIATSVGGVPESLGRTGDRLPGRLVDPGDPAALAVALREWLEDGAGRAQLREAARARATALPRWSDTSAQVARVLTAVAS
jgi:glycosyltransferase involved in cell wall biosynthesis